MIFHLVLSPVHWIVTHSPLSKHGLGHFPSRGKDPWTVEHGGKKNCICTVGFRAIRKQAKDNVSDSTELDNKYESYLMEREGQV